MNKKAVSPEMMVILLVFVIGAMILLVTSYTIAGILKEDTDIETCRLSVLAQAQLRKVPVVGVSTPGTIVPLDCPSRRLKIFENKLDIDGKESKRYYFKKLSSDELNHIIAEELRLCWYQMVEGTKDIFEYDLISAQSVCLICSEVEFDEKLKGNSYEGLLDYLKSRKIPKADVTYFNYLIRSQRNRYFLWGNVPWTQYSPWGYGTTQRFSEDKFIASQKYYIYFLAHKPAFLSQISGAYTQAFYIGLGKEEKLKDECSILMN